MNDDPAAPKSRCINKVIFYICDFFINDSLFLSLLPEYQLQKEVSEL